VAGWASRLSADEPALAWLRTRGVSNTTVARYHVGRHENDGVVVPTVRSDGVVGAVIRRFPDRGRLPKYRQLGPVERWWPDDPQRSAAVITVSVFDGLLARQHGIPAFCANGTGTPTRLLEQMATVATRVHVVPHVGEEAAGEQIAAKLREFGTVAWSVPLGLPKQGDDLADWFTTYGRTVRAFWARCRRARRAA
jgi:hypothetical protein